MNTKTSDDYQIKINLSDYLEEKLNYNYTFISNLFPEIKGTSIENYYLSDKIEKVKELLVYDELTLLKFLIYYNTAVWLIFQTNSTFKNLKINKRSA
jgi:hypothetical protein